MKYDDDHLKMAFLAGVASQRPQDRKGCPSLESLARSFEPGMSKRRKKHIVDHLAKCFFCQEEFNFYHGLQEFHRELQIECADDNHAEANLLSPKGRLSLIHPFLRFACLFIGLIIISTVTILLIKNMNINDIERSKPSAVVLAYPMSAHPISKELTFKWQKYPSAQFYVLELFNDSLELLWTSSPIQGLQLRLPHELGDKIKPGSYYYWMITAYSESFKIGESKMIQFAVH